MSRAWFKRLIQRPATPRPAGATGPPTRVVDVELYRGRAGGKDWTAEWGLLDEQTTEEITTNDLRALVKYVLTDARDHVGQHLEVTVQCCAGNARPRRLLRVGPGPARTWPAGPVRI